MRNQALISLFVTIFLHASVAGGVVAVAWGGGGDEPEKEVERKVMTIEASLAYKSEEPSELPQKERKRKTNKKASAEAKKVAKIAPGNPEKQEEQAQEEDFAKKFEEYRQQRQNQDDAEEDDSQAEESDTDVKPAGTFDGSKHGFAEISRGDPYMRDLAKDVYKGWELTNLETQGGEATGCVRLAADGSVLAIDLWKEDKANANLNLSVNLALEALKKQRTPGAAPIPAHLMDATTQWICFKFTVDQGS